MRARLLVALLLLSAITGAATGCKRKGATPPTMGKESTTVDTTKKQ